MSKASLDQGKQILDLFSRSTTEQVQALIANSDLLKTMLGAPDLSQVDRTRFSETLLIGSLDPYTAYRVEGLIFIGPEEIEKAFIGPEDQNSLRLKPGWCPRISVPFSVELLHKVVELCKTPEWNTIPILWLALPKVGKQPTSLIQQYNWWGVSHDGHKGGTIRQDTMYSNWFIKDKPTWSKEPAVTEPRWILSFELPRWSTSKNWDNQQKEAKSRGLTISSASRDHLMLDLVAITTGKKLRTSTWARTATIYGGSPLYVFFRGKSSFVYQDWHPGFANDDTGVAVEVVSKYREFI